MPFGVQRLGCLSQLQLAKSLTPKRFLEFLIYYAFIKSITN